MPTRLRNSLLLIALIAAALASALLQPDRGPPDTVTTAAGTQRGYYMNDATFSGLDDEGNIVYRLSAARIEGSDDSDLLDLRDVEIRYVEEQDVPWLISAQVARSQRDDDALELSGVVIETVAGDAREHTVIEADDLRFEPDRRLASTAGPVRFSVGGGRIEATGLSADLGNERFSLESGVSGRVAP